jgi:N-acetylmuramoyl-L-alanine amidase
MAYKIILDPGHGGDDPGALGSRTGLRECDVALWTCSRIEHMLRRFEGVEVEFTHHGGGMSLRDRAAFANQREPDLFVSVHANAHVTNGGHGFEVWTSPGRTPADDAATLIFNSVGSMFPDLSGRTDRSDGDPDKEARFYVLTHTACPAVLVEMAFITNFSEEILLSTDVWRMRYADAITVGIESWLQTI